MLKGIPGPKQLPWWVIGRFLPIMNTVELRLLFAFGFLSKRDDEFSFLPTPISITTLQQTALLSRASVSAGLKKLRKLRAIKVIKPKWGTCSYLVIENDPWSRKNG